MNLFKNIFARIWAFWGLLTFAITFLIVFIPAMVAYLIPDPGGQKYFMHISRIWMNTWLFLIGCNVKISGREHFKPGQTYVVVFNHNALLDVPLSAPYVPGPSKTIAKASFAKVPLFGWYYKKGSVLVDRKDEKSRVASFEQMKEVLAAGLHMSIYPEGRRNRTKESLKPFYDGAFRLALAAKKEIIPCIITGTKKAMPIDKTFYLLPVKLKMKFLPAVSSENKSVTATKDEVYHIMKREYEKGS